MKALVTGATGFVGSRVARLLRARGDTVHVLAREGTVRRNLAGLDVQVFVGDLTDRASIRAAVDRCDAVFHVAADYRLYVPDPEKMFEANVQGTRNVLECAADAGVNRVVYTSSIATLGQPRDRTPGTELTPVSIADMITPYKRSKYLAEQAARDVSERRGLDVVIVNPATPVGPGDIKPTPSGKMIRDAATGKIPAYVDMGLCIVHVDDVARGHLLAFERGRTRERYILGGENIELRTLLEIVCEIARRPAPRVRLPLGLVMPAAHVAEWIARRTRTEPAFSVDAVKMARRVEFFSSEKAARELGYEFRPVREALRAAVSALT